MEGIEVELRTFYSDIMLNYWLFQKFKLLRYDKFNNFNHILLTMSQFQFKIWTKNKQKGWKTLSKKKKNIMFRPGIPHSFFEGDALMF